MREASKGSKTYWLLGVFVVLLAVVVVFDNDWVERKAIEQDVMSPRYSKSVVDSIDSVDFVSSSGAFYLLLDDGVWSVSDEVDSYRAEAKAVAEFLLELQSFPAGSLVSRDPSSHSRYGVTASAPRMIARSGEKEVITVLAGSYGPSRNDFASREEGSDEVWMVKSYLKTRITQAFDSWRDKALFDREAEDVVLFSLRVGDEKWSLALADGVWSGTHSDAELGVTAEVVESYLKDSLASLRASDFLENELNVGDVMAWNEVGKVYAEFVDDSSIVITFFEEPVEGGRVVALRSDNEYVYHFPSRGSYEESLKPGFDEVEVGEEDSESGVSDEEPFDDVQ